MPKKPIDLSGTRFGRLVAVSRGESRRSPKGHARWMWLCACDCGVSVTVWAESLTRGLTRSCGCLRNQKSGGRLKTHGQSMTAEYRIWGEMKSRCSRPEHISYSSYGGRGITVCDAWRNDFVAFITDMGRRPSRWHSIDRKDSDGHYEPGNCRWATRFQQQNNRRNTKRIAFGGASRTVPEWSIVTGLSIETLRTRFRRGWTVGRALTYRSKLISEAGAVILAETGKSADEYLKEMARAA